MTALGFALFATVPFAIMHELCHVLAYVLLGGIKHIHIGVKKGIFYSTCSNYIISCKQYMLVALLPIVITFIVSVYIYCTFSYCRESISIFYLLQLLASNIDIGIASFCKGNSSLSYYEDHKLEVMYFIQRGNSDAVRDR